LRKDVGEREGAPGMERSSKFLGLQGRGVARGLPEMQNGKGQKGGPLSGKPPAGEIERL